MELHRAGQTVSPMTPVITRELTYEPYAGASEVVGQLTLVGDDAQRSVPHSLGLLEVAARLGADLAQMATAYRMSAEIADWLNAHAARHDLDAVELLGVRPTGIPVTTADDVGTAADQMRDRWAHVAVIDRSDVWIHKGVEYDAVVVDAAGMTPSEVYLSASRAAHQLVVVDG